MPQTPRDDVSTADDARDRRAMTLPVVAVLAAAAMLSLAGLQLALQLPGGQGIEDVLGWTRPESVLAALEYWRRPLATGERWNLEAAYLLVDTWLFMPLYAVLLALLARALQTTLLRDLPWPGASPLGAWMRRWIGLAAVMLTAALLLVDAVENHGGARRVGVQGTVFFGCLAAGGLLGAGLWVAATHDDAVRRRQAWWTMAVAFVVGALLAGWGMFGVLDKSACAPGEITGHGAAAVCEKLGADAHRLKGGFVLAAVCSIALAWLAWLYGADRVPDHLLGADTPNLRAHRARLRSGLTRVVWRTRYVMLVLALFAGLTLGLDQCRDVMLALAHWPSDGEASAPTWHRVGMVAMVGVAVVLFVYSTWLWARLACRIRGQRDVLATGPTPTGAPKGLGQGPVVDWDALLQARLGVFARSWVRALSLLPLLCIYALVAFAISDALNDAAATPRDAAAAHSLVGTVATLVVIGLLTVGLGAVFLMSRRVLSLTDDADYFNREEGLYWLMRGRDEAMRPHAPAADGTPWGWLWAVFWQGVRWLHAATTWVNPRTLPPAALGLALLLRLGLAWTPETMSAVPAALALLTLTLTWWMGVAGALTMAEVRLGRPYGLVLIVLLGLMAVLPLGVGDNHVLPLTLPPAGDAVLTALRMQGLVLMAVLSALACALWWLFTTDLPLDRVVQRVLHVLAQRRTGGRQAPARLLHWALAHGALQPMLRAGAIVLGLGLAMVALRVADRMADHPTGTLANLKAQLEPASVRPAPFARLAPKPLPTLDDATATWVKQLGGAAPGPVYLVASEGGGIRSAYWTALVLATLQANIADFDRRTFALSGVSGGAVGIAAYSACLREAPADQGGRAAAVPVCLKQAFSRLDPLSPLLGAWLFEDALARVLPVPMATDPARPGWRCVHPACAHLSRAVGFEREWVRAFPAMAQPLSAVGRPGGWEPHLLLNGTWVESGELAPVASLVIEPAHFPAARDVQRRLGRELSLIGGAHVAARFPFINPLAALQPAADAASATARGQAAVDALPVGEIDGHLADGGYFDNSAAAALTSVWRQVRRQLARNEVPRDLVVVLIRNGRKPAGCDRPDPKGPDRTCILPTGEAMPQADDMARPTRRRNWDLYADVLGPAVTVLNVSGIGAHGRHAPAMLRAEAAAAAPVAASGAASAASGAASAPVSSTRVRLVDQLALGTLVPLGWYLSPTARAALDREAAALADVWRKAEPGGQ